jgi:beta-hydroxylase
MNAAAWVGLGLLAALGATSLLVAAIAWRLTRMSRKQKKLMLKRHLRHGWRWLEEHGLVAKHPALIRDPLRLYPELVILERNHALIRKECRELMALGDRLPHIKAAGGGYTTRGIHEIQWNTFMLKSGRFLEENCRRAPETSRLLARIPRVETAFFSILGPGQYIRPHWGYYKGFLRYHLGVVIPNDNANRDCWLRVNDDREAYDRRDRSVIDETDKYYWHEGEGVVFDDTFLHDAANESDEPRAVLYLDLHKPLPWYLHWPNRLFIWLAYRDATIREIRRDAVMVDDSTDPMTDGRMAAMPGGSMDRSVDTAVHEEERGDSR